MHIVLFGLACFAVSNVLSAAIGENNVRLLEQVDKRDDNGFSWSYKLSDEQQVSQTGVVDKFNDGSKVLAINGYYSFIGTDGLTYSVQYYADETGYHPTLSVYDASSAVQGASVGAGELSFVAPPAVTEESLDPKLLASLVGTGGSDSISAAVTEQSLDLKVLASLVGAGGSG